MRYIIQAACGCHTGRVRRNNEDNFWFNGVFLEMQNDGLKRPLRLEQHLDRDFTFAVFDGMGGENFGEYASYAAAAKMQQAVNHPYSLFKSKETRIERLAQQLNDAVIDAQKQMFTEKMGTTMVGLTFSGRNVYTCNLGDSRAYRLRDGKLVQTSVDHVERRPGRTKTKAPLTQHLGFGGGEIEIEPHLRKDRIEPGDMFLICSDGLTDMLTDAQIQRIMLNSTGLKTCVRMLIHAALEHGGRDNITAIVCRVI